MRDTRTLAAAYAGMGAHAAVIPALLPTWSTRGGDGVLACVPALFGGLFAGVLASVALLAHLPAGRVLRGSAAAQALTLAALVPAGRTLAGSVSAVVVLAAASGVAYGVTESAASVAVRTASGTGRRLGLLLAASAASAAALPVLALVMVHAGAPGVSLLFAAAPLGFAALAPAVRHAPDERVSPPRPPGGDVASEGDPLPGTGRRPAPARVLVPVAVALALYVGVETLLSGWSAVLVHDLLGTGAAVATLGTSAFWLLMSAGRVWGSRSTAGGVPLRALLAGALFVAAAAAASAPVLVVLACAATVVVIAPTYARLLGGALERLDHHAAARWTGPLVAAGAAGGSLLPALTLRLGPPGGSTTFVVSAVACAALGVVARLGARLADSAGSRQRPAAAGDLPPARPSCRIRDKARR